ncbi:hypothetical protein D0859_05516 [Lecanosticta acicola]|uniref:O-methyltransferase C-terminal domain-containing protein n=1 Tax=Lecanosticta acicola TaxID=111012 RepID=A0AAI8YVU9_9PEZI|nr:hypothetical protein D0859_05516 [Lecanosticta acicola]
MSSLRRLLGDTEKNVLEYESSGDENTYREALASIRELQLRVEKPVDHANRVRFQILQNIALVMLAHLGVLQAIVGQDGKAITARQLAQQFRLMRILTATGIFTETDIQTYRSTPQAEVLVQKGQIAGMKYLLTLHGNMGSEICRYLDSTLSENRQPQSALQFAHNGKTLWQLCDEYPELRNLFNDYMNSARRGGKSTTWSSRYPPCTKLERGNLATGEGAVLMVDVGAGAGGQVGAFRKEFPDLPGKCYAQDLPETVETNSPPEGIEAMAYDFFTPQPLKGARFYLMRSVLHDWPDEDCHKILSNTKQAMDPEYSRLLLDEWVLPETGVDLKAACLDVNMMLTFNAMERSRSQWINLLDGAGFELVEVYGTDGGGESIIEAKVKG